jgi:hypothetical protein
MGMAALLFVMLAGRIIHGRDLIPYVVHIFTVNGMVGICEWINVNGSLSESACPLLYGWLI